MHFYTYHFKYRKLEGLDTKIISSENICTFKQVSIQILLAPIGQANFVTKVIISYVWNFFFKVYG